MNQKENFKEDSLVVGAIQALAGLHYGLPLEWLNYRNNISPNNYKWNQNYPVFLGKQNLSFSVTHQPDIDDYFVA